MINMKNPKNTSTTLRRKTDLEVKRQKKFAHAGRKIMMKLLKESSVLMKSSGNVKKNTDNLE
jgi:hypothetical protein